MPHVHIRKPFGREQRRKVDGSYIPSVKQKPLRVRQVVQPTQINLWSIGAKIVSNPPAPIEKVWIVARETDQAQYSLHDYLLGQVNECGEPLGIGSEIFLRQNERSRGGK